MEKENRQNAFKESFKNKRIYIIASILSVLGIGVPFLIYAISVFGNNNWQAFEYPLLMWAFVFLYALLGWVIGNSIVNKWRKKEADYDGAAPFEIKKKAWEYRMYFFLPALIILTVCIGLEICVLVTGKYPLLDYDYSRFNINPTNSN